MQFAVDNLIRSETEHELPFRAKIANGLSKADSDHITGYEIQNVGPARIEFKEPKPADMIEQLIDNGAELVAFFSTAISAEGIHRQFGIPAHVCKARVPKHVRIINLGAWSNDPALIRAIKEKIDAVRK